MKVRHAGSIVALHGRDGQPDGRFRVRIQSKDPARRVDEVVRSKAEAKTLLEERAKQSREGTVPQRASMTVADLAREFERLHMPTLSEKARDSYGHMLDRHIIPDLGAMKVADLVAQPARLQAWLLAMAAKKSRRGLPLTGTTIREVVVLLGNLLQRAVEWRYIAENPIRRLPKAAKPSRERRARRGLDSLQYDRLKQVAEQHAPGYLLALQMVAESGLRPGEARRATFGHIIKDGANWKILVPQSKTDAGVRDFILTPDLLAAIKSAQKTRGAGGTDFILVHPDNRTRIDLHNFGQRVLPRLLKLAGLEHIRVYDLRHTYNVLNREAKVQPDAVQHAMGHAKIATTLDVYGRVPDAVQADAAAKVAAVLRAARKANQAVAH